MQCLKTWRQGHKIFLITRLLGRNTDNAANCFVSIHYVTFFYTSVSKILVLTLYLHFILISPRRSDPVQNFLHLHFLTLLQTCAFIAVGRPLCVRVALSSNFSWLQWHSQNLVVVGVLDGLSLIHI